ncbi:hypothetical protein ABZT08_13775 [Streptomyces sp. NPDC005526]|uniref:hypothetical protein n=1 Tax=Streptomyces sp. NPDC005526 TaxID=3156885 RepID=UPI0033B77109
MHDTFANTKSASMKRRVSQFLDTAPCPSCHGKRLKPEALTVTFEGLDIADFSGLPLRELASPLDQAVAGMGAQTGGRVVTPPHRKFKKNAPGWYEERHELQRKAHSSRRIRVEHGIAHLKNWRSLARHHGRREHMSEIVQAVAGLLSHQQTATRHSGSRV